MTTLNDYRIRVGDVVRIMTIEEYPDGVSWIRRDYGNVIAEVLDLGTNMGTDIAFLDCRTGGLKREGLEVIRRVNVSCENCGSDDFRVANLSQRQYILCNNCNAILYKRRDQDDNT